MEMRNESYERIHAKARRLIGLPQQQQGWLISSMMMMMFHIPLPFLTCILHFSYALCATKAKIQSRLKLISGGMGEEL